MENNLHFTVPASINQAVADYLLNQGFLDIGNVKAPHFSRAYHVQLRTKQFHQEGEHYCAWFEITSIDELQSYLTGEEPPPRTSNREDWKAIRARVNSSREVFIGGVTVEDVAEYLNARISTRYSRTGRYAYIRKWRRGMTVCRVTRSTDYPQKHIDITKEEMPEFLEYVYGEAIAMQQARGRGVMEYTAINNL